jgi:hypothetical protein
MILGLCAGLGCTAMVCAQGVFETNATWQGAVSIATSNSVTWAEYNWPLLGFLCEDYVGSGPLLRSGTNFWYDFQLTEEEGPVLCPQFILNVTTPVPLGTLAPGVYNLYTTSWGEPVLTNTFTVAPGLLCHGFDTNGCFQVLLSSAVTNVNYVLECSTDMVHWAPVSTNTVSANTTAAAMANNFPVSPGLCYYRVACQ